MCSWVRFHNGRKQGKIVFVVCEQMLRRKCVFPRMKVCLCVLACVLTCAGQGWFKVRERLVVVIKQAKERRWILVLTLTPSLSRYFFNLSKLFSRRDRSEQSEGGEEVKDGNGVQIEEWTIYGGMRGTLFVVFQRRKEK